MKRIFALTVILLLLLAGVAWGATRTISDAGGNWNSTSTWVEGAVPVEGDNIEATATSGNLTVNEYTAELSGFDLTDYTGTLTINYRITTSGTVFIPNGVTVGGTNNSIICPDNGTMTVSAGDAITFPEFGGSNNITINLASDITDCVAFFIAGTSSTFNTNNFDLTTDVFWDHEAGGTVTLALGSSDITIKSVFDFDSLTSLTVSANTATITINPDTANKTYYTKGVDWNGASLVIYQCAGGTPALSGASTWKSITFNGYDSYTNPGNLVLYDNQTVTDAFTASSESQVKRVLICSDTPGTARTIAMSGADLTLTDVDLKDITVTGTPNTTNTRVGDCGNNTGAGTTSPKTVYMAGLTYGVNSWGGNHWADAAYANYTARLAAVSLDYYPLPQDTAIIDDDSFNSTSYNDRWIYCGSSIGYNLRSPSINASGYTGSGAQLFKFTGSTIYGSLNFSCSGNMSVDNVSFTNIIDATIGDITLTPKSGSTWGSNWTIQSYGNSVLLGDDLSINTSYACNLTAGTLDLNGHSLTAASTTNTSGFTLQDTVGGGSLILTGLTGTLFDGDGLTISNAPDIQIGDSTLTYSGDVTFAGAGKTYGDLDIKKHAGDYDAIITGDDTFGAITLETPDATYNYSDVTFPTATSTTCTSFSADGTADYTINIVGDLDDDAGENSVSYCTITDSDASGGADWIASTKNGNVDGTGNTGWDFDPGGGGGGLTPNLRRSPGNFPGWRH
jgi:hypothetical protein